MAGISSKALAFGKENKNEKFQGQPLDDDLGINYYGFKWRNHDPQIGRFIEIDPLSHKYVHNSTYAFSENEVTSHVELEGLEAVEITKNYIVEDGRVVPGAMLYMNVDNPHNLGKGTLTHIHFDGGEVDGKYYKPYSMDVYTPAKGEGPSWLERLLTGLKIPQLVIFGNGVGDFDMGSPINYDRPLFVFDFKEFKDLIDLANMYGEKSDGQAKSDPFNLEKFDKMKESASDLLKSKEQRDRERAANAGVIHCQSCGSNFVVEPDSSTHITPTNKNARDTMVKPPTKKDGVEWYRQKTAPRLQ